MFKISKNVSWTKCDNEVILVNTDAQKCIILDDTGEEIWELLQISDNFEAMFKSLIEKYSESDSEIINNDCAQFIEALIENEFISEITE